ncbi:hypothetical protein BTZ20_1990 [Rhodococcus sp. MTM3W5.2]|nr:hypothetical protein BTZ20_1990 [Rhodococcus sp. MTM3W5.2]
MTPGAAVCAPTVVERFLNELVDRCNQHELFLRRSILPTGNLAILC